MPSQIIPLLKQALDSDRKITRISVAYSGGLDSHVLLHALQSLQSDYGFSLNAIHVNHGISANAERWSTHCVQVCQNLGVDCQVVTVNVPSGIGCNLEEAARNARYEAFKSLIEANHYVATAHHADDQAETFLLQLVRGSGTKGLSAMPTLKPLAQGFLWRPLLSLSREALSGYATLHKLEWVEDESNAEICFDRNYLRHQVIPLLKMRWPHAVKAIGQSAKHCAEAELVLQELAVEDLSEIEEGCSLNLSKLRLLSRVRRHNVLRFWLMQQGFSLPGRVHLHQFEEHFIRVRRDANPVLCFANVQLRRHVGLLYALPRAKVRQKED